MTHDDEKGKRTANINVVEVGVSRHQTPDTRDINQLISTKTLNRTSTGEDMKQPIYVWGWEERK